MLPDGYLHLTECPELTIDYLDGGLPRRALRAVEAHLETCADCRKAVAEQKRIATLMQSQEQVNPPHALKSRVMAGLTAETAASKERYAAHARLWARLRSAWKVQTLLPAVAALLFLSVALGVFIQTQTPKDSNLSMDVSETTSQAASAESSDSPMSEYSSALDERGRTEETEGTKTTAAVQSMPATALMAVSGTPTSVGQTVYGTLSVELPPPLASTQWLEGRTTYAVVIGSSDLALLADFLRATGSRVTVSHAEEGQEASVEAIVRALATYPRMVRLEEGNFRLAAQAAPEGQQDGFKPDQDILLIITLTPDS